MSTQQKRIPRASVSRIYNNFTKVVDWRYQMHEQLERENVLSETIYWQGAINLSAITEDTQTAHIDFAAYSHKTGQLHNITDAYYQRDVDGHRCHNGHKILYEYSVKNPVFKEKLLEAQHANGLYFSVTLEEVVTETGLHHVSVLFDNESNSYGVVNNGNVEKLPLWFQIHNPIWIITETTQRLRILSEPAFRFQK